MSDNHLEDPSDATKDWMDLKIASMRSEMRLLFVVAVAGNQLLSHLSFSSTVAFVANGLLIGGAVIAHAIGGFR